MNTELIAKSLCFHGQPLQKIWEGERGNHDLYRLGLVNPDYSLYTARQKGLTFQDRAKRLKLHQFIARKADTLFDNALVEELPGIKRKDKPTMVTSMVMPPFETMFSTTTDKIKNVHHLLSVIQPGDIVYGTVLSRSNSGLTLKVLCTGEPIIRYLADINIKAYVLAQNLVPAHDKKGNPRPYVTNDYVCCEVLDISADADRMTLGMKGTLTIDAKAPLGFITCEQMPDYYKRTIENQDATYDELLETSKGFQNPNSIEILFQELGLDINDTFSHMGCFKHRFPQQEYATELRQIQASKWAFRSVADGIEHFKVGRHSEAFQCLNKALNIDPRNVEGLVARGALYANSGSFKKAVEDFETALKLNPYHANARKYMGETLVALGRSYEEENRIDEARKAYKDCLNIIPHHEEAKSSLDFINGKTGQGKQLIDTSELMLPSLKISSESKKDPSINLKKHDETKKEKSSKKKKVKNRKRKTASSSSSNASSSSNSSSSESSSTSGSSSGSTDSDSSQTQKTKRKSGRNEKVRQKSLSPLSKRMALMDEQSASSGTTRYQFNQPFHLANTVAPAPTDDYDAKVRNFLEITRDEDDYESRVRKLVEEASKYRKERKVLDEKAKKKDKKKQKKMKKETKKEKRRKEKSKEKMDFDDIDNMEFKEALKIFKSLPMLDIGSKLSADLAKYEKSIEAIQSRKNQPSTSTVVSKFAPKAYAFLNDSDTESPSAINSKIDPKLVAKSNKPETIVAPKQPKTPPLQPPLPVIEKVRSVEPPKVLPPKPPIVLDKFGCFRLATTDDQKFEPARRSPSRSPRRRYSRSRSRSRFYRRSSRSPRRSRSMRRSRSRRRSPSLQRSRSFRRSRSRSIRRSVSPRRSRSRRSYSKRSHSRSRSNRRNSKSPMRRRSRSFGSVGRRWVSRSHSRSFSRSRSRSREPWHRGRRGDFRGSRGFGFRGRRGRGRSGFRGRRSPFFRHNYDDRKDYEDRNNRRDDEHSSKKRTSKKVDDGIEGKWTHDKYERAKPVEASESNEKEENWDVDPTIEEIDKIIDKAQKERKEEILQRDKNLLKKQTPTNVPF